MATKISLLPSAVAGNLTGATKVPATDASNATTGPTLAQLRTAMFAQGTGYATNDPLVVGGTLTVTGIATFIATPILSADVRFAAYGQGIVHAGGIRVLQFNNGSTALTGALSISSTLTVSGAATFSSSALSTSATGGVGYGTGAGGAVTQATSRTTGVTLNTASGDITLVSAAGSTTWQTFTVTDSAVAATDTIHVVQKSGTDKYQIAVTNVAAGSFQITFATTGGTTTEKPVFHFNVIKGVSA